MAHRSYRVSPAWARVLCWLTLAGMGIEGGVAMGRRGDRGVGRTARVRPGQRHRGHGVPGCHLTVHRHPARQHLRAPRSGGQAANRRPARIMGLPPVEGDAGPAVPLPSDCAVRRAGRQYVVVPDGSTGSRSASWAGAWSKDSGHELGDHAPAHASQVCRADSLTRDPCPFRGHCLAATGAGRDRHRGQPRAGCALALPTSSSHLCPVSRWLWLAGAGGDAGRFAVVGVRCG